MAKAAAIYLLNARWQRLFGQPLAYNYVTLGGANLHDVCGLGFVDKTLVERVQSFETEENLFKAATRKAKKLSGLAGITVVNENIFDYVRRDPQPHIFFFDFKRACVKATYSENFADLFRKDVIRTGDTVLITSYRGIRNGWPNIVQEHQNEFGQLKIPTGDYKTCYMQCHPSFMLYDALSTAGQLGKRRLRSFGYIKYHDTTPMGLYGYFVENGKTDFKNFIKDEALRSFNMSKRRLIA